MTTLKDMRAKLAELEAMLREKEKVDASAVRLNIRPSIRPQAGQATQPTQPTGYQMSPYPWPSSNLGLLATPAGRRRPSAVRHPVLQPTPEVVPTTQPAAAPPEVQSQPQPAQEQPVEAEAKAKDEKREVLTAMVDNPAIFQSFVQQVLNEVGDIVLESEFLKEMNQDAFKAAIEKVGNPFEVDKDGKPIITDENTPTKVAAFKDDMHKNMMSYAIVAIRDHMEQSFRDRIQVSSAETATQFKPTLPIFAKPVVTDVPQPVPFIFQPAVPQPAQPAPQLVPQLAQPQLGQPQPQPQRIDPYWRPQVVAAPYSATEELLVSLANVDVEDVVPDFSGNEEDPLDFKREIERHSPHDVSERSSFGEFYY